MSGTFADGSFGSGDPAAFLDFEKEAKRKVPVLKQHVSAMETGAARGFNRLVAEAELDFAEADGYVKAMRTEFNRMAAAERRRFKDTLEKFQSDLEALRRDFVNAKARQEKMTLLSSGGGTKSGKGLTDRLLTSTEQLQNARRVVGETEQIGDQIASDMESQRRQLENAADMVQDTTIITKQARRVLNYMKVRAHQHKACLILIIMVLMVLIGVVFYYGIVERHLRH